MVLIIIGQLIRFLIHDALVWNENCAGDMPLIILILMAHVNDNMNSMEEVKAYLDALPKHEPKSWNMLNEFFLSEIKIHVFKNCSYSSSLLE